MFMDLKKHVTPLSLLLLLLYEESWGDREAKYVSGVQHIYEGSRKTVRCAIGLMKRFKTKIVLR